jgi:hypothetical protein
LKRAFLIALTVAVLAPASALAVWGGTVDTAHPGVGAMYFDVLGNGTAISDGLICSGSYAGRSKDGRNDVFLTAGHCMPPPELGITAGQLLVSFDGDGTNGVSNPIKVTSFHQMPGFGHDFGDFHDLGVLLLPAGSVPAGTPAVQLPPAGYLDRLKASGQLKFTIVDSSGTASSRSGSRPVRQFVFDGVRRAGATIIAGLRASNVIYNQNRHGIGTGSGLCFGDSGSPQLAKGTLLVLSVTSGGNGQCNANNQNYRVDTGPRLPGPLPQAAVDAPRP